MADTAQPAAAEEVEQLAREHSLLLACIDKIYQFCREEGFSLPDLEHFKREVEVERAAADAAEIEDDGHAESLAPDDEATDAADAEDDGHAEPLSPGDEATDAADAEDDGHAEPLAPEEQANDEANALEDAGGEEETHPGADDDEISVHSEDADPEAETPYASDEELEDEHMQERAFDVDGSEWRKYLTDDDRAYYYNLTTEETTWNRPACFPVLSETSGGEAEAGAASPANDDEDKTAASEASANSSTEATQTAAAADASDDQLPDVATPSDAPDSAVEEPMEESESADEHEAESADKEQQLSDPVRRRTDPNITSAAAKIAQAIKESEAKRPQSARASSAKDTPSSAPSRKPSSLSQRVQRTGSVMGCEALLVLQRDAPNPHYMFDEIDSEENIEYTEENGKRVVKAATMHKIIERMTSESHPDTSLVKDFLLTYRSVSNPRELFDLLRVRYDVPRPIGIFFEELIIFKTKFQKNIRLRVCNVLLTWLQEHWYDFEPELLEEVKAFIKTKVQSYSVTTAKRLSTVISRNEDEMERRMSKTGVKPPPPSILPKGLRKDSPEGKFQWSDFAPREIARQMTLIDSALYRAIRPEELMDQAWTKNKAKAQNVCELTARFNSVSRWVSLTVVTPEKPKKRAEAIEKLIKLAKCLLELNNFNGVMTIMSGLNNASVQRLKKSWKEVSSKRRNDKEALEKVVSHHKSFKNLREAIKTCDPPCIPFLGMYLSDLVFIEDGNKNMKDKLVNVTKRRKLAAVMRSVMQYQDKPYNLSKVDYLQHLISTDVIEKEIISDEVLHKQSLEREPREK